ncbi:diacylglycerol/lipid kinase family protein, partial [Paratractidigestivibacter sp.]|uniref:diacylglycerol/lipid kinase family protein n=1 Tax=Paratractidigestivibacter sp. TaxID=2847316 RepID=UPI004028838F
KGFDVVVISGGDGTASSVLMALAGSGVPTCVFPSGTANLFNANLGNTPEPQSLARACRIGKTADVDLGVISWTDDKGAAHERGFALMSGTGYDAQLMQAALPNKAALGQAAYYAAALENPRPEVVDFTVTVDGQKHTCHGIMCLVANNAMIQNEIQIVPNCRMDDGLLDVMDREGNKLGRPHIKTFRGANIVVETSEPVPLEVDGESEGCAVTRYEARALPGAARVIVDAMSPYGKNAQVREGFGGTEDVDYPK